MFTFWKGKKPPAPSLPMKTVAIYQIEDKFKDTKEPYTISFILKANAAGERSLEFAVIPTNQRDHIVNHYKNSNTSYLMYFVPWVEGTVTLEEIAKALPKLKIPPVQI